MSNKFSKITLSILPTLIDFTRQLLIVFKYVYIFRFNLFYLIFSYVGDLPNCS